MARRIIRDRSFRNPLGTSEPEPTPSASAQSVIRLGYMEPDRRVEPTPEPAELERARPTKLKTKNMRRPSGIELTKRDLDLIQKVGQFKFLTSFQIQRSFFPAGTNRTASVRLARIVQAGVLSRGFFYPKVNTRMGRPTAVYYFGRENQQRLKDWMQREGKASEWENFEHLPLTNSKEFSHLYIAHETGISEFFLNLEEATRRDGAPKLLFWKRTSHFSKEIGETLTMEVQDYKTGKVYPVKVYFNPDAVFALQTPDGFIDFYFFEYDNNTEHLPKYKRKLEGYQEYARQGRFRAHLETFIRQYDLPIEDTSKAPFLVLTMTPDSKRRDALFMLSLKLKSYKRFLFASLDDISPETILGQVWMRGKEFAPYADEWFSVEKQNSLVLRSRFLQQRLPEMPRVALGQ